MSTINRLDTPNLNLPYDAIADFCGRWKIVKLEVFGSLLRDDFTPESDVDFLVTFASDAPWSLFDLVEAEDELSRIIGRTVDLVEREPIEHGSNWMRRKEILNSVKCLYVA